jgi:hypothetical protein
MKRHFSRYQFCSSSTVQSWKNGLKYGLMMVASLTLAACGSGSMQTNPEVAPQITRQPASQKTRIGQSATFNVVATGTSIRYQWSKNGVAIPGATAASYNTPLAMAADDGESFSVTVANSLGSASSSNAVLSVGARAPQPGDLRFQQVAAPSTVAGLGAGGIHSDVNGGLGQFFDNAVGTPLTLGTGVCGPGVGNPLNCFWFFLTFSLPTGVSGLKTNYEGFNSDVSPVNSKLSSIMNGRNVFTSLDLQLDNKTYAASWIESASASGFQYFQQTAALDQFQAVATLLGQQSRVITAVSFDSAGDVYFVNYGWASDVATPYEVKVTTATASTVSSVATNLANEGYIITALGGNSTKGFLMVGTRVQGDSLARPVMVVTPTSGPDLNLLFQSGDAIVGLILNADFSNTYIGEQ